VLSASRLKGVNHLSSKTILPQTRDPEQLVDAGIRDGILHEVLSNAGYGYYNTRCGRAISKGNLIITKLPLKRITCPGCGLGNDADFEARKRAQAAAHA